MELKWFFERLRSLKESRVNSTKRKASAEKSMLLFAPLRKGDESKGEKSGCFYGSINTFIESGQRMSDPLESFPFFLQPISKGPPYIDSIRGLFRGRPTRTVYRSLPGKIWK